MRPASRPHLRVAAALAVCALIAPALLGAGALVGHDPRVSGGGADGGGSLPQAASPGSDPTIPLADVATPTLGVVIDATTRQPIPGAAVIVTDKLGEAVAVATTDAKGKFVIYLFDEPDLEIAIPSVGIAGIKVLAGDALLILVP